MLYLVNCHRADTTDDKSAAQFGGHYALADCVQVLEEYGVVRSTACPIARNLWIVRHFDTCGTWGICDNAENVVFKGR